MIKKAYEKPAMKAVKIEHTQMLCASLTGVQSKGLGNDDDESFGYGDGDKKSGNAWEQGW